MALFDWIKDMVKAVSIVTAIKPLIELLVNSAETPGYGPEKKAIVLKGIKDALTGLNVSESIQTIVLAIAGGVIETIVFVLNITKMFRHKGDIDEDDG